MKRLLSIHYSETALNVAIMLLRVSVGVLMLQHGFTKLNKFDEYQGQFMHFLGLSGGISLGLAIFAEVFCSILLLLGLLTRPASIILIINMIVAVFIAHGGAIFGKGEPATLYLIAYIIILLVGGGEYSVDAWLSKSMADK